ncbi:MAG: hypothetical protein H6700_12565 [Myxococcales bacterium]|nr:hypothetical protein [Myxococcales bacterium]MCB9520549.1 hypothetical protein [Myxococcales bacterium]MCB9532592.1 hypothetical protein [Myxococcales bacterium]
MAPGAIRPELRDDAVVGARQLVQRACLARLAAVGGLEAVADHGTGRVVVEA